MTTLVNGVLGITGLIAKGVGAISSVDQNLQIWGLSHLIGQTVGVFINGFDTGDLTVAADGSVTADISSVDHAVTAATLISNDDDYGESTTPVLVANGGAAVWVDAAIVVGTQFTSRGQRLRPASKEDVRAVTGAALGMTRRSHMAAVLIQDAVYADFGTRFDLVAEGDGNTFPSNFKNADGVTPLTAGTMFSGVHVVTLDDGYSFDSALCWQIDRPWPFSILAATQFLHAEERA